MKNGIMKDQQALIFCRTRQRVERLVEQLAESSIVAQGLHGEQPVGKRRAIVDAFVKKEFQILISTDLLARGIDIPNLPFVVNYDLPHNPEDYVHRVGRTGRAGAPGNAISLISREPTTINLRGKLVELDEKAFLDQISTFLGKKLKLSKVHSLLNPLTIHDGESCSTRVIFLFSV
jgi:superfamily II DNA/RNA helicase